MKKYNQLINPTFPNQIINTLNYRLGTADLGTYYDVIKRPNHLPPSDPKWEDNKQPKTIIDLGAHIGCTVLDYLGRFPNTFIIAIEPDLENYLLLETNINNMNVGDSSFLRLRPYLKRAAVSSFDNRGQPARILNPDSNATNAYRVSIETGNSVELIFIDMWNLLSMAMFETGTDIVDYIKMDIEGEEYEIFFHDTNLGWLWKTNSINIELHYEALSFRNEIKKILNSYDLDVVPDSNHPNCLVGYRWST